MTIEQLLDIAKKSGADAADVVMFESTSLSVSRRLGKPEGLEREESNDIGLRVFAGKSQAMVSSTDASESSLRELAERAVAMAKLAPEDPFATLAPQELLARDLPELDLYDSNEPTPEWLQEQCARAEDAARANHNVTNSDGAEASYGHTRICLATSHGFYGEYDSSGFSLSVSVIAGSGEGMESDYDYTSAIHREDLLDAELIGRSAAEKAVRRLNPRKVSTCQVPVVFDPRIGRGLVSTFAGAISGTAIARGTSFLKDEMGKQVFAKGITILDDPLRVRGLGSHPFDAEGLSVQKRALIEDGVLTGWLLDMRSANKLGLKPTGNASRGIASPPSPSSSNLSLQPGNISLEAMIGDIKNGLYVTDVFGMGVNTVTGDYSQGASGFWIEKGKLTHPVSELTIASNLKKMFQSLTAANDLSFRYATNAPTLRIEGMTVAGK